MFQPQPGLPRVPSSVLSRNDSSHSKKSDEEPRRVEEYRDQRDGAETKDLKVNSAVTVLSFRVGLPESPPPPVFVSKIGYLKAFSSFSQGA